MESKILNVAFLISFISLGILVIYTRTNKEEKSNHPEIKEQVDTCSTVIDTVSFDTIHIDRATTYNAVASQCDNDPLTCADGSVINLTLLRKKQIRWVALSRDLISNEYRRTLYDNPNHWRGPIKFGDTIRIKSGKHPHLDGDWIVHDCMNARYSNSIDFLFDPMNNKPKLGIGRDIKIIIKQK
jgi:hypothetical protein